MQSLKHSLRKAATASRLALPDKDLFSERILARVLKLPPYRAAHTALWYLGARSEVRTIPALRSELERGEKRIIIPWCRGDELALFHLENMDELALGRFAILEPVRELRELPRKTVSAREFDFALVPGVAFDRQGHRLGQGAGFFDKLLAQVRPDCVLAGIAFACQIVAEIPVETHDVSMDLVVTEEAVYGAG